MKIKIESSRKYSDGSSTVKMTLNCFQGSYKLSVMQSGGEYFTFEGCKDSDVSFNELQALVSPGELQGIEKLAEKSARKYLEKKK